MHLYIEVTNVLCFHFHPEPLTTPEELDFFMKLHAAMVFPNGDETNPMPIDFELLKQQFNHEVALKWREDPDLKTKHKMKTVTLSIKAGM